MRPLDVKNKRATRVLALSRTCRRLREVTLPLLWTEVDVWTVKELGLLSQLLKASPSIAPLVRCFSFRWQMDGDYFERCEHYPAKEGSLLDLAFRDRVKLWEKYRDL